MSTPSLTDRQVNRLMELVVAQLRVADVSPPHANEHEPEFTARNLLPEVSQVLRSLNIHGLVEAGEGGSSARPVPVMGLLFYPDLTVMYHGACVLAFEVKYLKKPHRQNALATALGQAYLYRQAGYRKSGAFLIDWDAAITDAGIKEAEALCRSSDIDVIIRRVVRKRLEKHPL